jgi:aspartyl-tRNA(Asn)/glutamyl-tRNA(Gln) amidotransferase subunit C
VVAKFQAKQYNKHMKFNVSHVAKLANLPLTTEEMKKLTQQLESTLAYIDHLEEVDTKNIKPTSQVTGRENVLRTDVAKESLSQEQALSNTKATENGFFKVKGVFEEE